MNSGRINVFYSMLETLHGRRLYVTIAFTQHSYTATKNQVCLQVRYLIELGKSAAPRMWTVHTRLTQRGISIFYLFLQYTLYYALTPFTQVEISSPDILHIF